MSPRLAKFTTFDAASQRVASRLLTAPPLSSPFRPRAYIATTLFDIVRTIYSRLPLKEREDEGKKYGKNPLKCLATAVVSAKQCGLQRYERHLRKRLQSWFGRKGETQCAPNGS